MKKQQNDIQKWIEDNKELSDLLVEIQMNHSTEKAQAENAFHLVSSMFGIAKMPEDIVYEK